MKKTSDPRNSWLNRTVLGVSLTSLFSDMSHEMATAILPFFVIFGLGGNAAVVGLIEGVSDGASSAVKSYSGYHTDKTGRRTPAMYLGYSLTAILIPAIGFATSWMQALVLRVGAWVGRGARGPPRDALLAESVPPESRGKAFGFQRGMDTIGAVIGPAIALYLIPYLSFSSIFLVSFVPGVISVGVVLTLVREGRRERGSPSQSFTSSIRNLPQRFRLFLVSVGLFGLANFSNVIFTLRAEQVLQPSLGAPGASGLAVLLYLVLNIVYAASSFPAGYLADRVSKKLFLASGYFVFSLACVASIFEVPSLPVLLVIFVLAGLHVAIVDTVEGTYAADLLDSSQRGSGYGALQTVNGVGDFVSSTMIGVLWTALSPALGFATVAAISGGAAVLLITTMRGAR
ncbi:MAG: MFS transporter [Nitrososphaerales archaeon]|nr:MFS transporter [Nitrososphaerales archaeon]